MAGEDAETEVALDVPDTEGAVAQAGDGDVAEVEDAEAADSGGGASEGIYAVAVCSEPCKRDQTMRSEERGMHRREARPARVWQEEQEKAEPSTT